MLKIIFYLLLYFCASSLGLLFLKKADNYQSLYFIFGNILYVGGYMIWALILIRAMPLSVAFPVASAGLLVSSQITGYLFLNEKLDLTNFLAITFMLIGLGILLSKVYFDG